MKKYRILTNDEHIYLLENIDNKKAAYIDMKAIKIFNKLLDTKLGENVKLETSENGLDKYVNTKELEIYFKNFEKIIEVAQELESKNKQKKQFILGTTTGVAATAGTLLAIVLSAGKVKGMEAPTFADLAEPISIEQMQPEEVTIEETNNILANELPSDGMVYASVDDYEYNGDVVTSSASLDTVYIHTSSNYNDELERNVSRLDNIVNTVSNRWGVSNDLIRDIMKQESHGGTLDNKMQIVFSSWHDQIVKVYNFETNRYETMVLTNTPEKYHNVTYVITREQLSASAETNINAGGIILAYLYNRFDHNLFITVQAYNFGEGATKEVITYTAGQLGMTLEEYKNSGQNDEFMKYTAIVRPHYGDPNYLYHVVGKSTNDFNLDNGKEYTMRYLDEAGNVVERTTFIRSAYTLDLEATVSTGGNLHM